MDLLVPLQNGDDEFLALAVLILAFLGGFVLMYVGFGKYRIGRLIANTPPQRVRSIAMGRTEVHGIARDAGSVLSAPFTDTACLYRSWDIEEERERRTRDKDGNLKTERYWATIDAGSDVVPFYVEDDTGRVFVDADDDTTFEISKANGVRETISGSRSFPPRVRSFMRNREALTDPVEVIAATSFDDVVGGHHAETLTPREFDRLDEDDRQLLRKVVPDDRFDDAGRLREPLDATALGNYLRPEVADELETPGFFEQIDTGTGGPLRRTWTTVTSVGEALESLGGTGSPSSRNVKRRRFSQEILPVDEEVYVFGSAAQRPGGTGGNEQRLMLVADADTGHFIVSDRDESGLVKYYNRRAPLYIAGGLLLSAGTLYLLLRFLQGGL